MQEGLTWGREQALDMLSQIASGAAEAAFEDQDGRCSFKSQTAMVALRAIDLANKMCGYAAPDDTNSEPDNLKLEDIL